MKTVEEACQQSLERVRAPEGVDLPFNLMKLCFYMGFASSHLMMRGLIEEGKNEAQFYDQMTAWDEEAVAYLSGVAPSCGRPDCPDCGKGMH